MNNQRIRDVLERKIIRYFIMASFIVAIELVIFIAINSLLNVSYIIATPASMTLGILLNWVLGKRFVFKHSRYKQHVELLLVVTISLIGIGLQLAVTSACVELLKLPPLVGKVAAIAITFFWNFWVRKRFIFHENPDNFKI